MSKYTTEVRFLCETAAGLDESKGFTDIDSILTQAAPKIFNFSFPIFDENYRLALEKTILRHYYTREISEETVGLWKLRLWDRLSIIMPYYNKLYLSETLEFNPLYDVDYSRTSTTELDGTSTQSDSESNTSKTTNEVDRTGSSTGTETRSLSDTRTGTERRDDDTTATGSESGTNLNLYSDTPQGALTGVENETYLTDARKVTDSRTTSNTTATDSVITYNTTDGHTGTVTDAGSTTDSEESEMNVTASRTTQGSGTVNNTTEFVEHVVGKQGSATFVQMIKEYRDALINIDQMILDELSDLFIALW